jgi:hypothetical protein
LPIETRAASIDIAIFRRVALQRLGIDPRVTTMLNRVSAWATMGALIAIQPVSAAPVMPAEALDLWSSVLIRFVDEQGRTDFDALAAHRNELDELVAYVERVSPTSSPELFPRREDVLAYHLNAYNALVMRAVIDEGVTDGFTSFFKRQLFFRVRKVTVGGRSISLSAYENEVIRPLGEPRVHFALNCMVRSCPRLPRAPFRAEDLEAQLEAAAREFLNDPRNVRVDAAARQVWLSAIFDFYTEDFAADGKRESLIAYVNRYRDEPIDPSFAVKLIPYDWTLNRQP